MKPGNPLTVRGECAVPIPTRFLLILRDEKGGCTHYNPFFMS